MRNSIFIKIQAVPLLQKIEHCHRVGEPHLKIRPNSLPQMFKFANLRQKREERFNKHPVVPLTAPTQFQILRLPNAAAKTVVCKDNHFSLDGFDQRQKLCVGNICRFNLPIGNESELICQDAELAADYPSPRSKTFASDAISMRLMIFPNRMTLAQCRKNQ